MGAPCLMEFVKDNGECFSLFFRDIHSGKITYADQRSARQLLFEKINILPKGWWRQDHDYRKFRDRACKRGEESASCGCQSAGGLDNLFGWQTRTIFLSRCQHR